MAPENPACANLITMAKGYLKLNYSSHMFLFGMAYLRRTIPSLMRELKLKPQITEHKTLIPSTLSQNCIKISSPLFSTLRQILTYHLGEDSCHQNLLPTVSKSPSFLSESTSFESSPSLREMLNPSVESSRSVPGSSTTFG